MCTNFSGIHGQAQSECGNREKAGEMLRSCFKTQFPLRTAAIYPHGVVGTKFVLDVALATPAAILNLRLARVNFARSRDESSFETTSGIGRKSLYCKLRQCGIE